MASRRFTRPRKAKKVSLPGAEFGLTGASGFGRDNTPFGIRNNPFSTRNTPLGSRQDPLSARNDVYGARQFDLRDVNQPNLQNPATYQPGDMGVASNPKLPKKPKKKALFGL